MNWFFKKLSTNSNVNGYEIDNLPIVIAKESIIQNITQWVIEILESNGAEPISSSLEEKINATIYRIYELTPEEIAFVEKSI